jgi:uncharacterized protein YbaR (Trm112 family)
VGANINITASATAKRGFDFFLTAFIRCVAKRLARPEGGFQSAAKIDRIARAVLDFSASGGAISGCATFPRRCRLPISERLLEILACPVCKVKVEIKPDGSGLKCAECKRVYPIRDDIPVMLVDEATVEE